MLADDGNLVHEGDLGGPKRFERVDHLNNVGADGLVGNPGLVLLVVHPALLDSAEANVLGDPYSKKSPLPRIGTIPHLPVSPSIPSHQILGQSQIFNRISLPYSLSRRAPTE
jgi:hypothetical protein